MTFTPPPPAPPEPPSWQPQPDPWGNKDPRAEMNWINWLALGLGIAVFIPFFGFLTGIAAIVLGIYGRVCVREGRANNGWAGLTGAGIAAVVFLITAIVIFASIVTS